MTLNAIQAARLATFAIITIELCNEFDASVTSWKRTRKRNLDVGGRSDSFHLEGLGADVELDDGSRAPAFVEAARARGLDAVDEGDRVHIELDYRRAR